VLRHPKLKGHLTLFPLSPARWRVSGGADELSRLELRNEQAIAAFSRLLPLLYGRHEAASLVARLDEEGVSRAAVEALLAHLERAGLLEEADDHGLPPAEVERYAPQIRYFSRFTAEGGAKLQARLLASRVAVVDGSTGRLGLIDGSAGRLGLIDGSAGRLAEEIALALRASGIGRVEVLPALAPEEAEEAPDGAVVALPPAAGRAAPRAHPWRDALAAMAEPPGLVVVAQEAHDPVLLEAMDDLSKRARLPWLLVRWLAAEEGWVGPLFVPYETASYLSLEARWQANLSHLDDYRALGDLVRDRGRPAAAAGGLLAGFQVLAGIAAAEAVKLLAGFAVPQLAGRFLTLHFGTWAAELHDVLRVPHLDRPAAEGPDAFPWQEGDPA